jgi:hypothetical protein
MRYVCSKATGDKKVLMNGGVEMLTGRRRGKLTNCKVESIALFQMPPFLGELSSLFMTEYLLEGLRRQFPGKEAEK